MIGFASASGHIRSLVNLKTGQFGIKTSFRCLAHLLAMVERSRKDKLKFADLSLPRRYL